MATRIMKTYDVFWSPTGQKIATVTASTVKAAKSKAPKQYRKYKGEMYVNEVAKSNPSVPKNKFIKCKAVKFNRNGSVSIKK
jgi:hypothetical protein